MPTRDRFACVTILGKGGAPAEHSRATATAGPPGVGKTHLAISLAIAAAQSGRRVYYGTLADLITSLEEAAGVRWR